MPQTVILGAGLSGLGCALGVDDTAIFEAADHVGGHAYSTELDGVWFDEGAHISHSTDPAFVDRFVSGRTDLHEFSPSIVRNHWQGSWTGYPIQNHLVDLEEELRLRALTDLVMAHVADGGNDPANYREWCLQQYGATLTDEFYEVYTSKYWRTDAADLATDWLGGRLVASDLPNVIRGALGATSAAGTVFEQFRYPRSGGFFDLFSNHYESLDIQLEHRAVEVDPARREIRFENGVAAEYEHLASSIPLTSLISIIRDAPDAVVDAAGRLRHTKLACVNAVVNQPLTDMHWCYVYDHALEPARVSFPSNLTPGSLPADQTAFQAEVFRADDEEWNVDDILDKTMRDMGTLLGFEPDDVRAAEVRPIEFAYVVSDHERAGAVDLITTWLRSVGVETMGLYGTWQYMWSDQAIASGMAAANRITSSR